MRLTLYIILLSLIALSCSQKEVEASYDIIPKLQHVQKGEERAFLLHQGTEINYLKSDERIEKTAVFLAQYIKESTELELKLSTTQSLKSINLSVDTTLQIPREGYKLSISPNGVDIVGKDDAGLFYGIQAFRKFIKPESQGTNVWFDAVNIEDYPQFSYRGMMLDVARHFSSIEFLKRYIDILALHNINKFHLHLTEDQGWRIEIKKYPKLTEVGSRRDKTIKGFVTGEFDNTPHGGYYTQEELRDLVRYAKERFIDIIPEVDLPGHMLAALASYPELGCTGGPYEVASKWGIHSDVLCGGNEKTYEFLEDVFTELFEIFPSEYIHIGGDECPKAKWQLCEKCQAKITDLGLRDDSNSSKEEKLQSYLTHYLEDFFTSKGRKLIGWDEIIEGGLSPNATVMSWRGVDNGKLAAQLGRNVVMVPSSHLYFDYYQTENTATEPVAFPEVNTIEEVYNFNPIPQGLTKEEAKRVIGVQANLWVEQINSDSHREYMTLPRLAALCEVQWSNPDEKDFKDFIFRLANLTGRYFELGYNFSRAAFEVIPTVEENRKSKALIIKLSTVDDAPVYYTKDGSEPSLKSEKYTQPILVNAGQILNLKAKAIRKRSWTNDNLYVETFNAHKALFSPVRIETEISKYFFPPRGISVLTDGRNGNDAHVFGDPTTWVGFGGRMSVVIDLEEDVDIKELSTAVLLVPNTKGFTYKVLVSADGQKFVEVSNNEVAFNAISKIGIPINKKARFVKLIIEANNYAHIVVDELVVN